MTRQEAIEAFADNGFSVNPVQFVAEKLSESDGSDGYIRYGKLSIEPASVDAVLAFTMQIILRGNRVNSLTNDTLTFLYSPYKTLLFDAWVYDGDPGNTFAYFVGYKMKM